MSGRQQEIARVIQGGVRSRSARRAAPGLLHAICSTVLFGSMALGAQQSRIADSQGRLQITPEVMAGQCVTMVSPHYPPLTPKDMKPASVVVAVSISVMGRVSPLRAISGPPALQAEAMNAVRMWRYTPYTQNGVAQNITTEVRVPFAPGKPGGLISHPHP